MNMILILLCLMSTLDGLMSVPDPLPETTRAELEFTSAVASAMLAESNLTKNVIFSPHSIYLSLLYMYLTSNGNTEKLMQSFLRFDPHKIPDKTLIEKLVLASTFWDPPKKYELTTVDRLYHTKDIKVKQDFAKTFQHRLAEFSLNDQINEFISDETNGMIKEILEKGKKPNNSTVVFVNAAYFKGYWTHPFHHEEKKPFTLPNGKKVDVTMMTTLTDNESYFHIMEDEQLSSQIIALPYQGDDIFMVIILPKPASEGGNNSLTEVVAKLSWSKILELSDKTSNQKKCNTEVTIPKFNSTQQYDLIKIFDKIGGKELFSGTLDLSNAFIKTDNLITLEAKHKATVNVYENGTEAAAATQVTLANGATECKFYADHSFVYAIYEVKKQLIHYAGIMIDPTLQ